MIIGRWNPLLVVLVARFFGVAQAYSIRLQTSGMSIPFQLILAIPYLLTPVVLFGRLGRGEGPREVGRAWSTESL